MSWTESFTSPIAWPVAGFSKAGGGAMPEKWLEPAEATNAEAERSRDIIVNEGRKLTHSTEMRLKRHCIEGHELVCETGKVRPAKPIHLIVQTDHRLEADADKRELSWRSLDHVMITTFSLLMAQASEKTFAPRYIWSKYRDIDGGDSVTGSGVAHLKWALAGFKDQAMLLHLEKLTPSDKQTPLFIAGSVVSLTADRKDRRQNYSLVMPWMGLNRDLRTNLGEFSQAGLAVRAASADLWVRRASLSEHRPVGSMASDLDELGILSALHNLAELDSKAQLEAALPVEQAFYEKIELKSGKWEAKPFAAGDAPKIPFFLRTLVALADIWRDPEAAVRAVNMLPVKGKGKPGIGLCMLALPEKPSVAAPPPAAVPVNLIVLSRAGIIRQDAYRSMNPDFAADLADGFSEIANRAKGLDRFADIAVRETNLPAKLPAIVVAPLDGSSHAMAALPASPDFPRVSASAALGWPSPNVAGRDLGAGSLAPELGGELPVQSADAGFAGRFQQFGYPAVTSVAERSISFSNRIAFQRSSNVPYEGPAARHLAVVNARLRSPLAIKLKDEQPVFFQLMPFVERATIGRRPGVIEAAAAYVTEGIDEQPFDEMHPRFGRPAASGPAVAHQFRTPRSPPLPGDLADRAVAGKDGDIRNYRRRTYVSLADVRTAGSLATHLDLTGAADALRHDVEGADTIRLSVRAEQPRIGPGWNGEIVLKCESIGPKGAGDDAWLKDARASVEIGQTSFPATLSQSQLQNGLFDWTINAAGSNLFAPVVAALRSATVDTPMRLVIDIEGSAPGLRRSPAPTVFIPLELEPGDRQVLPAESRTIVFGDPAYDRQLGSVTQEDDERVDVGGDSRRILLACDRKEYPRDATVHFAAGWIVDKTGAFEKDAADTNLVLTLHRRAAAPGETAQKFPLKIRDGAAPVPFKTGKAYEFRIAELRLANGERPGECPGISGDQLELSIEIDQKKLSARVYIVDAPAIGPPPSVYSVLRMVGASSRTALHAAAPLPQRIEFPDLIGDLARGHVRRRALFVWRHPVEAGDEEVSRLLKCDRSGGAQL